jgi:hypothetical protein
MPLWFVFGGVPQKMTSKPAYIAVYGPPKSDLPHIAVVIYPDGEVTGLAAVSAAAAETLVTELALKMGAHMGDNDR